MAESASRGAFIQRLRAAAQRDLRVVGLVDYGSSSEGRADEWSDVDVTLFLRDADYDAFSRDWVEWAAQFGELLLVYVGQVGHPWTVYAAEPVPLRVDFEFQRESQVDGVVKWPNSPASVEAMVLYDGTGGRLTACVRQMVGRPGRAADLHAAFEQNCGDLWYFLLFTYNKLQRGQVWVARQAFHYAMDFLYLLLRLEAGATDRWEASQAAADVERTLAPERLARLEDCVPGAGAAGIQRALVAAATLGYDVCAAIASQHGWTWPHALADRVVGILPAWQE